jgi:putative transposase
MSTTYPSDLTDAEWAHVQRYLPPVSTRGRPRTYPLRRVLDVIFYVLRTECAWRYLPTNFPPWQTMFYHFRRFRLTGRWHLLYTAVHRAERVRVGRHPDPSAAIMDSQSVKTVEESARIRGYDAHKCVKGRSVTPWSTPWASPSPAMSPLPMSTIPSACASSWAGSRASSRV